MNRLKFVIILSAFILVSCDNDSGQKNEFEFKKDKEIKAILPKKPVKIKVKRGYNGRYSWELTGDDVNEIAKINKTLEKEMSGSEKGGLNE